MYNKLRNNTSAIVIAVGGYPLFFYIYNILKYYFAGAGGGEIIAFLTIIFAIPYCIFVASISVLIFILQKCKLLNKNIIKNEDEDSSILKKTLFLLGFILYFGVSLSILFMLIYSILFC